MSPPEPKSLKELRGIIASVCTTGLVTHPFSIQFSNLRDWNTRNGYLNVEYRHFDAKLVEDGRDAVVAHALQEGYDFVMMIDSDAAPFAPNALEVMLKHIYVEHPELDMIGGYCQLKAPPHLPTIDTGTGRWEPILPGQGLLGVIRTGGHFICFKTSKLHLFGPPWFRARKQISPARAMKEVDNFARITLHGENPFVKDPEWDTLLSEALDREPRDEVASGVGEDSSFCDNLLSVGGVIAVDTDFVVGHVMTKILEPSDLEDALHEMERNFFRSLGVGNYD